MAEVYNGKPCNKCGRTLRYKSNWCCVKCQSGDKGYTKKHPEAKKRYSHTYSMLHGDRILSVTVKRRAKKLKATPEWLSPEQLQQIRELYKMRKRLTIITGIVYHVDHIVSLTGKTVCGLHVPWNLQLLTHDENHEKGNRLQ